MSIDSALVDLRLTPAAPAATHRGIKVIAAIRGLVAGARWAQTRPYVNVGGSYLLSDRRRASDGGSTVWIYTHH